MPIGCPIFDLESNFLSFAVSLYYMKANNLVSNSSNYLKLTRIPSADFLIEIFPLVLEDRVCFGTYFHD